MGHKLFLGYIDSKRGPIRTCLKCGFTAHRDVNASCNIEKRDPLPLD